MRLILILLLFTILSTDLKSQVSLVPASHQVYEWLHLQRVKGNISNYSYESLPLTRKQINELLKQVENAQKLNRIDQRLLKWYTQEFSVEQLEVDSKETFLQGWEDNMLASAKSKVDLLFSDREPHLFVFYSDSIYWAVDYSFGGGTLTVDDPFNDYNQAADISYKTLRSYGTIYNTIGAHIEISNPYSFTTGQFRYHPEWGQTFNGRRRDKNSTIYTEAYFSLQYKNLGFHAGNGDLKYGNRGDEAQILRQEAGNFDWFRINFDSKYLQYTYLFGGLEAPTRNIDIEGFPGVKSRVAVDRWFALRRFQITPAPWISMAFTESLIYSNRGLDFAYMNPVLPLKFGEFENSDRDNPIWFFDGSLRPIKNLEFYATIGIDDLFSFSDIFKPTGKRTSEDAVISYQAGFNASFPTSTIINAEIIRFDPFFYTHWQFFNTYHELGSPLGATIGPNSQQLFFSVRQWLPWRSFIDVAFTSAKKGLNILDDNGDISRDVGGDIFEGQLSRDGDEVRFMDGDIHRWNTLRIQFEIEPTRGIKIFADYRKRIMLEGEQMDDFGILFGGLEVYFYPFVQKYINKIPGINKAF